MLHIVVALGPDRPTPGSAKTSTRRNKLNLFRRRIDLIKRDRIPDVAAARTVSVPGKTLSDFHVPVVGLLEPKVRVELTHRGPVGIEKRIDGQVLIDGGLLNGHSPRPSSKRGLAG